MVQVEPLFLKSLLPFENELVHQEIRTEIVNIVHNIIVLPTSIIVLQTLRNTIVAKAVATFCHVCLLNHVKADGAMGWRGVKIAGDCSILSFKITLGMWRFTSHDASNIIPHVNRDPIRF